MPETATAGQDVFLDGEFLQSALPSAAANRERMAWVTDCPGFGVMMSDGLTWNLLSGKRTETYTGTTDASGNYTVVFSPAYLATPHINPVTYPSADSTTRVRVTAASATGFTVKTERNPSIDVLGIAVLQVGTANVISVPVRVLVVGN